MSKHCSPAKKLRSSKRLINYLLMKRKLNLAINFLPPTSTFPARNVLSISHQSSWSLSPYTKLLARSKPVLTDFPPDPKKTIHLETYQELISKYENLQSAIIQWNNQTWRWSHPVPKIRNSEYPSPSSQPASTSSSTLEDLSITPLTNLRFSLLHIPRVFSLRRHIVVVVIWKLLL